MWFSCLCENTHFDIGGVRVRATVVNRSEPLLSLHSPCCVGKPREECVCCRIDSNADTEDVRYMVFSPLFRKGSPEKRTEKGTNSDELCILIEIFE